ncbi:uncharacterized protein MELLADRAFT_53990 [Melampsora larici-populina 98AG31]|uniref:sphingolipid C(9)-methyltransferase n=1 Tax=Melampsora larici-populina (strain 98AG31 / pathotype 3-4-7) TaxID=747676 RepID=F4S761_MELLP|nr:uncharacterized protein MELLADRAFT_53990 [Melampsora larici-populina 98AG31]EGF99453.1 hypothetical protein MELLADRAFT_53990 [Melampsora larici-populina 98AG31]
MVLTQYKAIKNAVIPFEAHGRFSNLELFLAFILGPYLIGKYLIPFITPTLFSYLHFFLIVFIGPPIIIGYWTLNSIFGQTKDHVSVLPNKALDEYFVIKDVGLSQRFGTGKDAQKKKIPMQVWHDAYFDGKIELKGDMLDTLEYRHDWASFQMTPELFKYVLTRLIPEVILHTTSQDEEQVRDHYDRGDDFYRFFLGPRMVYTSGIISNPEIEESLEELQDNKMRLVCKKLGLKESDHLLDIGCGWGTLAGFAAKNYGCEVTGITLGKNPTKFGNQRLLANGISKEKGRIICQDVRDISVEPMGRFNKIVSLEMAEHVGIRKYLDFLKLVYKLLSDDGVFVFQVAGIRTNWQYEDLIWGLFMNKYVFPGADASLPLGWVISKLEQAGFEIRSVDVLGVHYSATIWRWYKNWMSNKDEIVEKYGDRWFRVWEFFLAYSVITPRQGSVSVFQITCHKNLNKFDRVAGIKDHTSLYPIMKEDMSDEKMKTSDVICQEI